MAQRASAALSSFQKGSKAASLIAQKSLAGESDVPAAEGRSRSPEVASELIALLEPDLHLLPHGVAAQPAVELLQAAGGGHPPAAMPQGTFIRASLESQAAQDFAIKASRNFLEVSFASILWTLTPLRWASE